MVFEFLSSQHMNLNKYFRMEEKVDKLVLNCGLTQKKIDQIET